MQMHGMKTMLLILLSQPAHNSAPPPAQQDFFATTIGDVVVIGCLPLLRASMIIISQDRQFFMRDFVDHTSRLLHRQTTDIPRTGYDNSADIVQTICSLLHTAIHRNWQRNSSLFRYV